MFSAESLKSLYLLYLLPAGFLWGFQVLQAHSSSHISGLMIVSVVSASQQS